MKITIENGVTHLYLDDASEIQKAVEFLVGVDEEDAPFIDSQCMDCTHSEECFQDVNGPCIHFEPEPCPMSCPSCIFFNTVQQDVFGFCKHPDINDSKKMWFEPACELHQTVSDTIESATEGIKDCIRLIDDMIRGPEEHEEEPPEPEPCYEEPICLPDLGWRFAEPGSDLTSMNAKLIADDVVPLYKLLTMSAEDIANAFYEYMEKESQPAITKTYTVRPAEGEYVCIELPGGVKVQIKHESEGVVVDTFNKNNEVTNTGYYFWCDLDS